MEVGVCHFSSNKAEKKSVLAAFKKTVAEFNSEFEDDSQKVRTLFSDRTQQSSTLIFTEPVLAECPPSESLCAVCFCAGRPRVPQLCAGPAEVSVRRPALSSSRHGRQVHLPCQRSHRLPDVEHQDLQGVRIRSHRQLW